MRRSRLPALALILAVIVLSVAAVVTINQVSPPLPSDLAGESSAASLAPASPEVEALQVEASESGPPFELETGSRPTGDVQQSKLWFHDGTWWGLLVRGGDGEFRIQRFDWAGRRWLDTGTSVASRASLHPDVVAEGDGLWVATGGGHPIPRGTIALMRYTYDSEAQRYVIDPDFPVTIAAGQEEARALTLARDEAGILWAAWIRDGRLILSRTAGSDWTWLDPQIPPVPGADAPADAAAVVAYGDTVALVWSSEDAAELSLAVPRVGDPEDWERQSVPVEGLRLAEDQINISVLETGDGPRLFAVIRTSLDTLPGSTAGDPQVVLLVVEPDGMSQQYLVGRVSDDFRRPIVLVDRENEVVYVVATRAGDVHTITYKASAIDDISFEPGPGQPLIAVDGLAALDSVTSTKQTLDSASGLLVLASDADAGSYAWSSGRLPGPGSPVIDAVPEPVPSDDPLLLATFDPFEAGSGLDPTWVPSSTGDAAFAVSDTDDGRRVAAASATDGSSVRICHGIKAIGEGLVRIEADVSATRIGGSDATITSARHDGAQTAEVRFDDSGVFSYFDGPDQVRSAVRYTPGVWYTSVVELDLDARTYDWRVQRPTDGVTVFTVAGAGWRTSATGPITDVCLASAEAAGVGTSFAVDRIRVER